MPNMQIVTRADTHKATAHQARDSRRQEINAKKCATCSQMFIAHNKRKLQCPDCDAADYARIYGRRD